jgi:hypothetical protein
MNFYQSYLAFNNIYIARVDYTYRKQQIRIINTMIDYFHLNILNIYVGQSNYKL